MYEWFRTNIKLVLFIYIYTVEYVYIKIFMYVVVEPPIDNFAKTQGWRQLHVILIDFFFAKLWILFSSIFIQKVQTSGAKLTRPVDNSTILPSRQTINDAVMQTPKNKL